MSSTNAKEREYELVQEDLEEVMRKYDRESNVRVWQGKPALIVKAILIGFSLFSLIPCPVIFSSCSLSTPICGTLSAILGSTAVLAVSFGKSILTS